MEAAAATQVLGRVAPVSQWCWRVSRPQICAVACTGQKTGSARTASPAQARMRHRVISHQPSAKSRSGRVWSGTGQRSIDEGVQDCACGRVPADVVLADEDNWPRLPWRPRRMTLTCCEPAPGRARLPRDPRSRLTKRRCSGRAAGRRVTLCISCSALLRHPDQACGRRESAHRQTP